MTLSLPKWVLEGRPGRFFSWAELTRSSAATRLGLNNTPHPEAELALRLLCQEVLDPLREDLDRPVLVTSAYRTYAVNVAVGGSRTSQHMRGEAADIQVPGISAEALAARLVLLDLPCDQVIWYDPSRGGHVHVSYTAARPNRGERLHAPVAGGYRPWSP